MCHKVSTNSFWWHISVKKVYFKYKDKETLHIKLSNLDKISLLRSSYNLLAVEKTDGEHKQIMNSDKDLNNIKHKLEPLSSNAYFSNCNNPHLWQWNSSGKSVEWNSITRNIFSPLFTPVLSFFALLLPSHCFWNSENREF